MDTAAMPITKAYTVRFRGETRSRVIDNGWSPEEEEAVREHYPRHGRSWDGWGAILPARTPRAISAHARALGVTFEDKPHPGWTEEECDLIREYYEDFGADWEGWRSVLPRRSPLAIRTKANRLGIIAKPRWSCEEMAALFRHPFRSEQWSKWKDILPGRSEHAIRRMRGFIGLWGSGDASKWDRLIVRLIRKTADYTGLEAFEVIKRIWELRFEITEEADS